MVTKQPGSVPTMYPMVTKQHLPWPAVLLGSLGVQPGGATTYEGPIQGNLVEETWEMDGILGLTMTDEHVYGEVYGQI